MATARKPAKLGKPGSALWRSITEKYELRPDEHRVLEDACREADLIGQLEAALDGAPMTVAGSMGQLVAHPIVQELRQHRATLGRLLGSLKLKDTDGDAAGKKGTSGSALEAAAARWSRGA